MTGVLGGSWMRLEWTGQLGPCDAGTAALTRRWAPRGGSSDGTGGVMTGAPLRLVTPRTVRRPRGGCVGPTTGRPSCLPRRHVGLPGPSMGVRAAGLTGTPRLRPAIARRRRMTVGDQQPATRSMTSSRAPCWAPLRRNGRPTGLLGRPSTCAVGVARRCEARHVGRPGGEGRGLTRSGLAGWLVFPDPPRCRGQHEPAGGERHAATRRPAAEPDNTHGWSGAGGGRG